MPALRRGWLRTGRPLCLSFLLAVAIAASLALGPGARGVFGGFLAAIMLAIAAADARRYIIPNELTAAAAILALLYNGWVAPDAGWQAVLLIASRAIAASVPLLLLMVVYRVWRGRDGLGLGDVKLAAVAGAWLDWLTIAGVIELAAISALATYLLQSLLLRRPLRATAALPFGLFFAPSIWIGWLIENSGLY